MTNVARLVLQMDLLLFDTKFDSMLFNKINIQHQDCFVIPMLLHLKNIDT